MIWQIAIVYCISFKKRNPKNIGGLRPSILFVVSIVGTYLGKIILRYISEDRFRIIVLMLIFITGVLTIFKYLLS